MARENHQVTLAERPKGDIIPGQTFKHKTAPAPTAESLKDGQVLVENIYASLDPAMRGWLSGKSSPPPPPHQKSDQREGMLGRQLTR